MKPVNRTWRDDYYRVSKLRIARCLEPTETCEKKPIRAHSIQNATVFDLLAFDGHVMVMELSHDGGGPPHVAWRRSGRNKASTFTGLCDKHDHSIFRPIDASPPNFSNPEHLFLLAYRSVLRELHLCIERAVQLQVAYQRRVELGRSPSDKLDSAGVCATAYICNAYDCYLYKRQFDQAALRRDFDWLLHKHMFFGDAPPSIAVSSLFSLDDMPWPDDVARVVLNVIPIENGCHVVFSFVKSDAGIASRYLQEACDAGGLYQRYLVSKLILQHCENIVMAPSYYEGLTETRRNRIREYFASTIFSNQQDHDDENLYLF